MRLPTVIQVHIHIRVYKPYTTNNQFLIIWTI